MRTFVAFLLIVPFVLSQTPPPWILELSFLAVDGDKDGHISLAEYNSYFEAFDADKDGHITMSEYLKSTRMPADVIGPLFQYLDTDHSRTLDLNTEGLAAFHAQDLDGDNSISKGEFNHEQALLYKIVQSSFTGVNPVG